MISKDLQPMTIRELAQIYKGTALSETAIRRAINAGKIKAARIGVKFFVTPAAVEDFLLGANEK